MEDAPIRYLKIAILQEQDVDLAMRALDALNISLFHLSSTGGFLGRRNATLLVGMPEGKEEEVRETLQKSCRQRVEYLAIPLEGSPLPLPTPVPVTVGGATVFTIKAERFEEF
jgi:uncharacterized protein YaaQ